MKLKSFLLSAILSIVAISFSFAQTADEVVAKYLQAKGGADKIKTLNTAIMTGEINQGGTKIPITIYGVNSKAFRIEFTFNGLTGYQIITDTSGWNFNPFAGQSKAERMTADDIKSSQDQLDLQDDLLDYAAKGSSVEMLGKDDVEGTECYKLKLTLKSGKEKTLFIGTGDNLLIKSTEKITANGQELESSTFLSNYKPVGPGVLMPFSIMNNLQGQIDITNIEVNKEIDAAKFKP